MLLCDLAASGEAKPILLTYINTNPDGRGGQEAVRVRDGPLRSPIHAARPARLQSSSPPPGKH